jgi:hypothetical protein
MRAEEADIIRAPASASPFTTFGAVKEFVYGLKRALCGVIRSFTSAASISSMAVCSWRRRASGVFGVRTM